MWGEEHQQRKDLKTTKQHIGNEDPFRDRVHTGKVIRHDPQAWPEVIQCCDDGRKGGEIIHPRRDDRQHTDDKDQRIRREKAPYGFENTFRQRAVPQFNAVDRVRVDQSFQLTVALLEQQQNTNHLQATARRPGAATNKRRAQQEYRQEQRPARNTVRGKSGRRRH